MHHGDFPGQQCELPVFQGTDGTVAHIPHNCVAGMGELQPDLMPPAGFRCHLQQTPVPGAVDQAILQAGFAAVSGGFGKDTARKPLAFDVIVKVSVRLRGRALDNGQIGFLDRPATKLGA